VSCRLCPTTAVALASEQDRVRATVQVSASRGSNCGVPISATAYCRPYIGVAYTGRFGETATFVRQEGESVDDAVDFPL